MQAAHFRAFKQWLRCLSGNHFISLSCFLRGQWSCFVAIAVLYDTCNINRTHKATLKPEMEKALTRYFTCPKQYTRLLTEWLFYLCNLFGEYKYTNKSWIGNHTELISNNTFEGKHQSLDELKRGTDIETEKQK